MTLLIKLNQILEGIQDSASGGNSLVYLLQTLIISLYGKSAENA